MPVYTPIRKASHLPEVGAGFETDVFDAKGEYDSTSVPEIAKDLAGFANHLGGTIDLRLKAKNPYAHFNKNHSGVGLGGQHYVQNLAEVVRCWCPRFSMRQLM